MAAAPLSKPQATPVDRINGLPGILRQAQPLKSKIAAISTKAEINMRMGSAGIVARKYTPTGIAKKEPMSSQRRENQSIFFQTCAISLKLANTSRMSTTGTTWAGANTSDMLVTATMAKPNPLYPLIIPAMNTAAQIIISVKRSVPNKIKELFQGRQQKDYPTLDVK
jgi:hypothetical protein